MVQLEPNLHLTLKNLAPYGTVVSTEQAAALDYSITIKRVEAGLRSLNLWGKVTTLNGKDYLIAEGNNPPVLGLGGTVQLDSTLYYSLDGVKWVDLPPCDEDTTRRAGTIEIILQGDPAKAYEVLEDPPARDANSAAPQVEEEGEDGGPVKLSFQISELAVLRQRVDAINMACSVVPVGSVGPNAHNKIVPNCLFSGLKYPEKLESYSLRTSPPGGATLAAALRGEWAVNYDPFKQTAAVRSLLFPGYTFVYNGHELTWGGMYSGDGCRNNDLIFML